MTGVQTCALPISGALIGVGVLADWDLAMLTLSIMLVAVAIALVIGIPLGVLTANSDRAERIVPPSRIVVVGPTPTANSPGSGPLTLRLRGVDFADAFQALGLVSGTGFIVDADVIGQVSLDVTRTTLGETLALLRRKAKIAIEESGRTVAIDLERFLTSLGTIAAIAPLLGLFGTVVGMIEIFGSQTPQGSNPLILANGISIALYNTAFGLVVAVPAMIFYRYFRAKVDEMLVDMEMQAIKLIEIIHGERQ